MNVTWHHNVWSEDVAQALLGRFGSIHVFNNLFASEGGESVISTGCESRWLLDNNWFRRVNVPHKILDSSAASIVD